MSSALSQEHDNLMCLTEVITAFKHNLKHRPVFGGGVAPLVALCQENQDPENCLIALTRSLVHGLENALLQGLYRVINST